MMTSTVTSWGDVATIVGLSLGVLTIRLLGWAWDRAEKRFEPVSPVV